MAKQCIGLDIGSSSVKVVQLKKKGSGWALQAFGMQPLASLIAYGASPRATIFLGQTAQAHAFLDGRDYVTPEDVKAVAPDVFRHRVVVTYEAEAEELTSDELVKRVLAGVPVP